MFPHADVMLAIARDRQRDLFSSPTSRRLPARDESPKSWDAVLIRESDERDASRLQRLADLDSRTLPAGRFLIAEVGRELVAAAPLDVREPALGDPFRPTEEIRRLLDRQAKHLRRTRRLPRNRGGTLALLRRAA